MKTYLEVLQDREAYWHNFETAYQAKLDSRLLAVDTAPGAKPVSLREFNAAAVTLKRIQDARHANHLALVKLEEETPKHEYASNHPQTTASEAIACPAAARERPATHSSSRPLVGPSPQSDRSDPSDASHSSHTSHASHSSNSSQLNTENRKLKTGVLIPDPQSPITLPSGFTIPPPTPSPTVLSRSDRRHRRNSPANDKILAHMHKLASQIPTDMLEEISLKDQFDDSVPSL